MKDSASDKIGSVRNYVVVALPSFPVDPAGPNCYQSSTKPCKFFRKEGERLSNTWVICPWVGYNLGKLRIIPHRFKILECA